MSHLIYSLITSVTHRDILAYLIAPHIFHLVGHNLFNTNRLLRTEPFKEQKWYLSLSRLVISLYGAGCIIFPVVFQKPPIFLINPLMLPVTIITYFCFTRLPFLHSIFDFFILQEILFLNSIMFELNAIIFFVNLALEMKLPLISVVLVGATGGFGGIFIPFDRSGIVFPSPLLDGVTVAMQRSFFISLLIVCTLRIPECSLHVLDPMKSLMNQHFEKIITILLPSDLGDLELVRLIIIFQRLVDRAVWNILWHSFRFDSSRKLERIFDIIKYILGLHSKNDATVKPKKD